MESKSDLVEVIPVESFQVRAFFMCQGTDRTPKSGLHSVHVCWPFAGSPQKIYASATHPERCICR